MNPYRRAALFLIRLTAIGLVLISLVLLSRYVLGWMAHQEVSTSAAITVLQVVCLVGGMILLIKSDSLAGRLTEDLEETPEKTVEELLESDDDER